MGVSLWIESSGQRVCGQHIYSRFELREEEAGVLCKNKEESK